MAVGVRRCRVARLLAWHFLHVAHAFVPTSQNYDPQTPSQIRASGGLTQYVWTLPPNEQDSTGLGGGLAYAWDPALCDQLLPNFGERSVWGLSFVTCKSLRAAMERAFQSWEANHPIIRFHDISNICRAQNATPPSGSGCGLAEIWITNNSKLSGGADQAATALLWTHTTASPTQKHFHFASGTAASNARKSISRATIGFSVDICWYLDSTFCSQFHSLKDWFGATEFLDVSRIVFLFVWSLVLFETGVALYKVGKRAVEMIRLSMTGLLDTDGDGEIEYHEVKQILLMIFCCQGDGDDDPTNDGLQFLLSEEASTEWYAQFQAIANFSACCTSARIIALVLPPLFWFEIFLPCWECYDFEAAASHEVGHALGLYHPDQAAPKGTNLRLSLDESLANSRTDPSTGALATSVVPGAVGSSWSCDDPWANVVVNNASEVATSLMEAFTQAPSGVCVRQDDLDGLNTLYPPCENAVSSPQCWKSEQYLGLVRLTLYVGVPAVAILLTTLLCHKLGVSNLRRRRDDLVARHLDAASEADKLRLELQAAKQGRGRTSGVKKAMAAHGNNKVTKQYTNLEAAGQSRSQQPPPSGPQPAASVPKLTPYAPGQVPQEYTRPPLPPGKTATVAPAAPVAAELIGDAGMVRVQP